VRGLYAICDLDFLDARAVDPVRFAAAVLAARPAAFQLRAKHAAAARVVELLRTLVVRCREQETPLFANDRPDLAAIAQVSGVHVGQDDLSIAQVRAFDSRLRMGVSTHTIEQLAAALEQRPDYVALGPIFHTGSKQNPDATVGVEQLEEASALTRRAQIPLVAIGGITLDTLDRLKGKVDCVAVISGLFPINPPTSETELWPVITAIARQYQTALQ
jgi:thiamine-phosphate pyrophosphorylase